MSEAFVTPNTPPLTRQRVPVDLVQKTEWPDLHGMRVMLITPNDYYRKKLFGLGPAYIARALQRCNIEVSVMSCEIWSYDDIEVAKILIQSGIKIFGIGALYPMFKEVERLCNIIRAVVPDATIILGGGLPSPIAEFALRKTRADIATIGEAELTIPALMTALGGRGSLDDVRGIAFIRDGEFKHTGNPLLPRFVTRDEVGWPFLDPFPIERYVTAPKFYPFNMQDRVFDVVTGRGCPYSCNFCYRVNEYRIRPYDDILDEMEYLIDRYKLDGFYFVDDLMMLSERKITALCEGILSRGLRIRYNMSGRVNTVTPEIVKLLKQSGCVSIYYGVESGNEQILRTMSKRTSLEQIYEAVRLTREAGIYCEYGLMFGQPGETAETLRDSVELIKKISYGEYRAQKIFGCVPFPGTGLYAWCKQTRRVKDDEDFYNRYIAQDWSLDQVPVNMTDLPNDEVRRLFKDANEELSRFYLEKMSDDWIKFFSGDAAERGAHGSAMRHVTGQVEAGMHTHDLSGRSH
ncbi:MAG: B12-binding domain-containing radical SAM protein [Candidatus Rokubacteria bacterium]|nr:B12-binding domain-containing radical SAM protein [Candidatus Rokubacteria bacterium]